MPDPDPPPRFSLLRWSALEAVLLEYWSHRPLELAAALSYYTILSLAPLVLMAVGVAGLVFERTAVEEKLVAEMGALIGAAGAEVTRTVLHRAHDAQGNARSLVIGLAVLLVGATTVFAQLQGTLNRIWRIETSPTQSLIGGFIKERLLSIAMVLAIGFLRLVSLLVCAGLTALADSSRRVLGEGLLLAIAVNMVSSIVVTTILFAMIFKILPDTDVAWDDVWFGAFTTAVLFTLGKGIIGLYLGRAGIGSAYGAAGSLVVMTVWVYYASLILFFGAELTYFRSRSRRPASRDTPG